MITGSELEFLQLAGGHNDGSIFMRAAWVAALAGFLDRNAVSEAGGA